VPPTSVLMAAFLEKHLSSTLRRFLKIKPLLVTLVALIAIFSTWRSYIFDIYRVPKKHQYVLETAAKINQLVSKEATLITTSHNSAVLQYYADRRGEYLVIKDELASVEDNQTIFNFNQLMIKTSADYFAIADTAELHGNPDFMKYLERYEIINPINQDQFRIYKLN